MRRNTIDFCIKVKDRPFAEGSRGCHALFIFGCASSYCKGTSRYIAPCDSNLYYAVRRFYFFTITSSYNVYFPCNKRSYIFKEQFLLLFAPMTTYLKDLIQFIGRYGGLSWQENGFKVFGCISSIST